MNDIKDLDKCLKQVLNKDFKKMGQLTQNATLVLTKKLKENIKNATDIPKEWVEYPSNYYRHDEQKEYETYMTKFKEKIEKVGEYECRGKVYNDYLVTDALHGREVPLGYYIEFGTGPFGFGSVMWNPSWLSYYQKPWDTATRLQFRNTLGKEWGAKGNYVWTKEIDSFRVKAKDIILKKQI